MQACLMLSGVGKSGSPAPKSTTSKPCDRSRSASAATFMVEDTLIEEIRSAICVMVLLLLHLSCKSDFHGRRHQVGNVAAQAMHFLHQPGADERVRLAGHQEHGL